MKEILACSISEPKSIYGTDYLSIELEESQETLWKELLRHYFCQDCTYKYIMNNSTMMTDPIKRGENRRRFIYQLRSPH